MLLLCSFLRLKQEPILIKKELFQVNNGLTTSLLFFFFSENAKNLGRSDDAKQRKKRTALSFSLNFNLIKNQGFF